MTFSETGDKIYQFRGIRYGTSTAGQNRFRKPQPVEKSDAMYNATSYGAICPQMIWGVDLDVPMQSEDCLFLNVYVPKELQRQALPVMIWVHGGGLAEGYSQIFDGSRIAVVGDVIVVTINYRLGFFGFLSFLHPSARGNWGLWDQQLAFQWVHDNILAFGGNPDSVTIFGESSGGESVSYHSIIPSNKGLFQRVIAQSGSMSRINMLHRKQVETLKSRLPVLTGCFTNDLYQLVDCLRRKSVADLVELSYTVLQQPDDQILIANVFGIAVDGDMFPAHPFRLLANRTSPQSQFFKTIDYMAGTTSQEGQILHSLIHPSVAKYYGFNISVSIPAEFTCNGMLRPFVEMYYDGSQDVAKAACAFYNSSNNTDELSNRAIDFMSDLIGAIDNALILDLHHNFGGCKTYLYNFDRTGPLEMFPFPPNKWLKKGAGHTAELIFLFKNDDSVSGGLFDANFTTEEREASQTIIQYWTSFAKSG